MVLNGLSSKLELFSRRWWQETCTSKKLIWQMNLLPSKQRLLQARYLKQRWNFIPLVPYFTPENCNYRFTAIWYPCLSLPTRHWCQSRLHMVNCFNLMSAVPADVSLHYTLRQAKPKEQHSRFEMYKWGEGWGSTDPLLKGAHNSHRWMFGNLCNWWDKIHFGDIWNPSLCCVICTYVSTT